MNQIPKEKCNKTRDKPIQSNYKTLLRENQYSLNKIKYSCNGRQYGKKTIISKSPVNLLKSQEKSQQKFFSQKLQAL